MKMLNDRYIFKGVNMLNIDRYLINTIIQTFFNLSAEKTGFLFDYATDFFVLKKYFNVCFNMSLSFKPQRAFSQINLLEL